MRCDNVWRETGRSHGEQRVTQYTDRSIRLPVRLAIVSRQMLFHLTSFPLDKLTESRRLVNFCDHFIQPRAIKLILFGTVIYSKFKLLLFHYYLIGSQGNSSPRLKRIISLQEIGAAKRREWVFMRTPVLICRAGSGCFEFCIYINYFKNINSSRVHSTYPAEWRTLSAAAQHHETRVIWRSVDLPKKLWRYYTAVKASKPTA